MTDVDEPLSRRSRLLPIACTILAAELISFTLLVLRFPVSEAVGYPVVSACCILARCSILRVGLFLWHMACRAVSPLGNRRTYRFRLSTLLIFIGLICCVLGWHSYKRHTFYVKYPAFAGRWR